MSIILVEKSDVCMAKYTSFPICNSENQVVCGNCNLSFKARDYIRLDIGKETRRYISNCPHCGKWNKMRIFNPNK